MPKGIYKRNKLIQQEAIRKRTLSRKKNNVSAWNKGLKAKTDIRVKRYSRKSTRTQKILFENGLLDKSQPRGKDSKLFGRPSPLKGKKWDKPYSHLNKGRALPWRINRKERSKDSYIEQGKELSKRMKLDSTYKDWRMKRIRKGWSWYKKKPNRPEKKIIKMCRSLKIKVRFNGHGKYFSIEGLAPDIQLVNQKHKFILHHGTIFHADPTRYKLNDIMPINKKKAKDLWKSDKRKQRVLRKNGCKLLIVWERELKDVKKLEKKILRFLCR